MFPPDRGVKRRQLSLLLEAAGAVEFPGRETLLDIPAGEVTEGRFIPPLRCAEFVSENRRHPESLEVVGLPLKFAPRSACCAFELLKPPLDGVRTPGVGRATEFWFRFSPLENDWPAPSPLRCSDCRICVTWRSNDCGAGIGRAFEKKCCCTPPRGNVDAAAGRLLTDNADRVGTTGRLPAIICPLRKVSPFTPTGVERPVPNWPVGTVEMPPRTLSFIAARRKLEYAPPARSGA